MAEPHVVEAARCPVRDQSDSSSEVEHVDDVEYWGAVDADADGVIQPIYPGTPTELDVEPLVPRKRIRRRLARCNGHGWRAVGPDRGLYVVEAGDTICAEHDLFIPGTAVFSIPVDEPHAVPAAAKGVEHAC